MKSFCTLTALALLVAVPLSLMAAEDGAAVYKSSARPVTETTARASPR